MTISLLIAMCSFSLAMSISPGPVNMIIVSSGANYGVRKSFAFVSGATIGFILLLAAMGMGLSQFVNTYPQILNTLAALGSLFILYLAYLVASANPELKIEQGKVPNFQQGLLLQWLNPKAWMACVSSVSLFSSPDSPHIFVIFLSMYFLICYLSLFAWSLLGDKASQYLSNRFYLRCFNLSMGALLALTALYLAYLQFLA